MVSASLPSPPLPTLEGCTCHRSIRALPLTRCQRHLSRMKQQVQVVLLLLLPCVCYALSLQRVAALRPLRTDSHRLYSTAAPAPKRYYGISKRIYSSDYDFVRIDDDDNEDDDDDEPDWNDHMRYDMYEKKRGGVNDTSAGYNFPPDLSTYEWRFARGVRDDIKARLPHYKSDWQDGMRKKSISAILFLYFACLAPTVAFGGLTSVLTDGKIGVIEFIISCGVSGVTYSVFSGQPMTFLGPTGLTLAFITSLYKVSTSASLPFMGIYQWTGLWTALFLALCSLLNTSNLIRLCTRFTDDVFNALLAVNFLYEASKSLVKNFAGPSADLVSAFAALNLAMSTWLATRSVVKVRRGKMLNKRARKLISDFGPTAVLLGASLVSCHPAVSRLGIERLAIPSTFTTSGYMQNLAGLFSLPVGLRLACSVPAVLLTMLFFLDQNISVRAVNACKLRKGDAYHLDLLVLSALVAGLSVFGLPWTCAATVQSLNHVRAMADVEVAEDGSERLSNIVETRLTGFVIHAAILGSLFLLPLLSYIPMPVISGIFLYLGRKLMKGNLYFDRMSQLLQEKRLLGADSAYRVLGSGPVGRFLAMQSGMLYLIWALKQSQKAALLFPSCIALLMALRLYALPRLFSPQELAVLDPVM